MPRSTDWGTRRKKMRQNASMRPRRNAAEYSHGGLGSRVDVVRASMRPRRNAAEYRHVRGHSGDPGNGFNEAAA